MTKSVPKVERVFAIVKGDLKNPVTWIDGLCPACGITNKIPSDVVYAQCGSCLKDFFVQSD